MVGAMEEDWTTLDDSVNYSLTKSRGGPGRCKSSSKPRATHQRVILTVAKKPRRRWPARVVGGSVPTAHPLGRTRWPSCIGPNVRSASDCSGINTAHIALRLLGLNPTEEFLSEKDPATLKVLTRNFSANHVCADLFERDDRLVARGSVDIYTAGPPCQTFSQAGKGAGVADLRGIVFLRVLRTINATRPKTFVLENVPGLKFRHPEAYSAIIKYLQDIRDERGNRLYKVRARMLDTCAHGGLPQSRKRVYIVGWIRVAERFPFDWPEEIQCASLEDLLDDVKESNFCPRGKHVSTNVEKAEMKIRASGGDPNKDQDYRLPP